MRPLQISPDTALKLSKNLGVPLEQVMHRHRHILLQKLAEMNMNKEAFLQPNSKESN